MWGFDRRIQYIATCADTTTSHSTLSIHTGLQRGLNYVNPAQLNILYRRVSSRIENNPHNNAHQWGKCHPIYVVYNITVSGVYIGGTIGACPGGMAQWLHWPHPSHWPKKKSTEKLTIILYYQRINYKSMIIAKDESDL